MDFDTATKKVNDLKESGDNDKLEFYGLFKQATVGNCSEHGTKPGMMDFKGKAKYGAWEKNEGMTAEDAKAAYVKKLETMAAAQGVAL